MKRATLSCLACLPLALLARQDGEAPAPTPDVWDRTELEQLAKRIEGEVEVLRGERFREPVKVEVANKQEFFDYAMQRMELTETPEKLAADQDIARLLALVPPDMDLLASQLELLEAQVGGFYDPGSKTFFLMDVCPRGIASVILAHELGHALDDQLYDIDAGALARAQVTDQALAYHMVVEGSGTAVMTRWTMKHLDDLDLGAMTEMQSEANASMSAAPAYLWKPLLGSYMVGAAFLAKTNQIMAGQSSPGSNESIAAAFASPPRSTEQALHPEKYWDAERVDEPTPVAFATDALPDGWNVLREDVLGELVLGILTTPEGRRQVDFSNQFAVVGLAYTNDAAAGWDGDRCILLGKDEARFLRLATVWDSERDAAEFYGAMLGVVPDLEDAAQALGSRGKAEVAYGATPTEVVLDVSFGARTRERRELAEALAPRVGD